MDKRKPAEDFSRAGPSECEGECADGDGWRGRPGRLEQVGHQEDEQEEGDQVADGDEADSERHHEGVADLIAMSAAHLLEPYLEFQVPGVGSAADELQPLLSGDAVGVIWWQVPDGLPTLVGLSKVLEEDVGAVDAGP